MFFILGSARGHKFGQGVSFFPDYFYASHYRDKSVISSEVLVAKTCVGGSMTVLPQAGYDTTINSKSSVYVKYDDNSFYPNYIIHYY